MLYFHAEYSLPSCETLEILRTLFRDRLTTGDRPVLAVVNSPTQYELFNAYNVKWFPSIVFIPPITPGTPLPDPSNDNHVLYPKNGVRQEHHLLNWITSKGLSPPVPRRIRNAVTKAVMLEARNRFKPLRDLHSACVMLQKLQCIGDNCANPRRNLTPDDPPMFIFLGGGMAAGKTTAATALTRSEWWSRNGKNTVIVNADEFKKEDPLFPSASPDLHVRSTQYAEKLLVTAINQGRDIIFDGTMMWYPFIQQTVEMIRNATSQLFQCGPGYIPSENIEQYWEVAGQRRTPLPVPYVIRMIGITVEPQEAVPRAIIRQLTTGRGVPVEAQLKSFKLFAEHFEGYMEMCDEVVLYNNNIWYDLEDGEEPQKVASKVRGDNKLIINDLGEYERFMAHKNLNPTATCVAELFSSTPPYSPLSTPTIRAPVQSIR